MAVSSDLSIFSTSSPFPAQQSYNFHNQLLGFDLELYAAINYKQEPHASEWVSFDALVYLILESIGSDTFLVLSIFQQLLKNTSIQILDANDRLMLWKKKNEAPFDWEAKNTKECFSLVATCLPSRSLWLLSLPHSPVAREGGKWRS